jgi:ferredoxin
MRVSVNPDRCQGHSMCVLKCPKIFQLDDDDGHASALVEKVPAELESAVRLAADSCPEQAIELSI